MAALIAVAAVAVILLIILSSAVRVAREYERGVIFRLGRLKSPPKGPGLFLLIPIIDKMVRVDLRTVTLNVPPQEVITKDNVPVRVNAVAYFRIIDPEKAIVQIENFMVATSQISQTTLRSVLGQHSLDELLSERDKINAILQQIIDEATSPWGIKVSIVEVKDVEIPGGMQRAMARQAEAERERRAKVIAAEGEFQASERLKDAAQVLSENPMSLQLRFLQTMLEISSERSSTIILPLPIELFRPLIERLARLRAEELTAERSPRSHLRPDRGHRAGAREAARSGHGRDRAARPRRARAVPVLRRPRRPHAAGDLRAGASRTRAGQRPAGRSGSSPTSSRRSSTRKSSSTRRGMRARSPSSPHRMSSRPSRRSGTAGSKLPAARLADPFLFLNEGREAGASLPHSHSQLAWLREAPPEVAAELPNLQQGTCALCSLLEDDTLEIALAGDNSLRAAHAGRVPYELLIAPERHEAEPDEEALVHAATLLHLAIRRLHAVEGPTPLNAWLHTGAHWHLEIVPRLTVFAGLELGAGLYVNWLPPEEAATRLR